MIRVLQVFGWTDRGGAETMVMNYYRNIDRTKIQFDFVKHTTRRCAYDDEIESLGGRIYVLPEFTGKNLISYHRAWVNFLREHPEWHTIHIHRFTVGSPIAYAAKCAGIKNRIIHVHSVGRVAPLYSPTGIFAKLNTLCFRHTANILFACGELSGKYFYGKHRFAIQPNAIDVKKFKSDNDSRALIRKQCGFSEEAFVIAHVGRFIQVKNHSFLIKIFIEVLKQRPEARLLLVGDGETRKATEDLAVEADLRDKVYFAGLQNNVSDWLQAADIFVLPSIMEGLPVCVVEAQAAGLTCVMSDHLDKSVDVSKTTKFVPVNSEARRWADVIIGVPKYDKHSIHNKIIESEYNIENAKDKLMSFYLNLEK